ncbi:hypothetical protein L210DRAFT_961584 [Boletus edulis BED1]|uniref:Uncharacterized protein n=1 Tax=Boletus edulis BED1 TaxID=1328754 RepID=A0AAD4GLK2_BOLED|nr:hypothetical protein L210DRAFT_961584 [Boletus edulis BED1]
MLSIFSPSLFSGSMQRYRKVAAFSAAGSIHAIAISLDGQLTSNEVTAMTHLESRGIVSSTVWMKTKHTFAETLCYGTGSGYIVFIRSSPINKQFQEICAHRLGLGFEITCLAWDLSTPGASCIAIGTCDNVVQIQSVFAVCFDNTVPKEISSVDHRNLLHTCYCRQIVVTYFRNRVKMSRKDRSILSEYRCQSVIGSASVYLKKGMFIIDNATNSFTMYHLDGGEPIRTFITDPPSIQVPKQVAFGEDYRIVVGRSNKGTVFVFDRRTGNILDTIQHASATLVQTIALHDLSGQCIIACTSPPVDRKKALITIWTHQYNVRKEKSTSTKSSSSRRNLSVVYIPYVCVTPLFIQTD